MAEIMKSEQDGKHPASHYLVVEDEESPSTWHLRVMDAEGKADHGLMGAAWAALHSGYRGNKYEGPGKAEAVGKLKALYKAEKMQIPADKTAKSGARHSAGDQAHLDKAADHMYQAGANMPTPSKAARDAAAVDVREGLMGLTLWAGDAVKSLDYAMVETWDIQKAAQCMALLADLAQGEAMQGESENMAEVGDIMKRLLVFIGGEIGEMLAAAKESPTTELTDMGETEPSVAIPANAWNVTYIKSLHLPHDTQFVRDVLAVKSTGPDTVRGYSMLWGNPALVDVEGEYFTKATDFWDLRLTATKPLTWDHAQDPTLKGAPVVIGQIVSYGDDEVGRWYEAQLDRAHKYRKAIDRLISAREVGTSSDSAPQYVMREKTARGSVWLKCWPWFASALTTTPAEPRMFGTLEYYKSLGVSLPELIGDMTQGASSELARRVEHAGRLHDVLRFYL